MRWAGLKGHNWANKQPKLIVKKKTIKTGLRWAQNSLVLYDVFVTKHCNLNVQFTHFDLCIWPRGKSTTMIFFFFLE
jgi:hypothetical protein